MPLWFGVNGYPGLGVLRARAAGRCGSGGYARSRGGIRYPGHDVETRGIFRTQSLDRTEVHAVHVRRVGDGQPQGWFDTAGRPIRIQGISFRHPHSFFERGPCHICADFEVLLEQVAVDLDVDFTVDPVGQSGATP
ncbi:MAG: hypothetical protein R2746_16595 [Acidimicrobiales bacterium]